MLKSPVGTLTFLMTDIEGSTRLWEEYPAAMTTAIVRSEQIIHEVVTRHDGYHVVEQGEGDSTLSVFNDATEALRAAEAIRDELALEKWADGLIIRVRIGLHSGVADMRQQTYYGRVVNRAARVRAVAHGGQIIFTRATRELLDRQTIPSLKDHGSHRLKDLLQPEHLFELAGSETFPPFKTLSTRPNNLPVQLTPFVGRASDILEAQGRLAKSRLVTVVGSGGCGKTRLALQVAAETLDNYPDGAFFVDLTSVRSYDEAARAILRAVRADSLEALKHSGLLVIVDNCEHIVDDSAHAIQDLLEATETVAVLATSREALHLRAESLFRLSPLSLPSRGSLDDLDEVTKSEAVQLFSERAAAKLHGFTLTIHNCRAVGELCIRLDGIPLAIELAVPRLKLLSPAKLLGFLDERFKLLKTADRNRVERHQTLLAAIAHSYDLLSGDEAALFRSLAVFRGGCVLEAARAVAPERLRDRVLDLTEALLDKSLVQTSEGTGGDARLYLLESIRQFARMKLAGSSEEDRAFRGLCEWCTAEAKECQDRIRSGEAEAVARFDREMPNIEEALDWAIRATEPELGLTLAANVWEHWSRRGIFTQARAKLRALLNLQGSSDFTRALGSSILGTLAYYQDDLEEARACFETSLRLYNAIGDVAKIIRAKNNLGLVAVLRGDLDSARSLFDESFRSSEATGDVPQAITTGLNLGTSELDSKRPQVAHRLFKQLLSRAEDLGDALRQSLILTNLAECSIWLHDGEEALKWLSRCFGYFRDETLPNTEAARYCLISACALALLGNLGAAATIAEFGESIQRESESELTGREKRLNEDLLVRLASLSREEAAACLRFANGLDRKRASAFIEQALSSTAAQR